MGNPGRSARVKVDPGRLVGDLDRSGCDMLPEFQMGMECKKSQTQNCGVAGRIISVASAVWKHNAGEMKFR